MLTKINLELNFLFKISIIKFEALVFENFLSNFFVITKSTFRPIYQNLFLKLGEKFDFEQLPDYFLLQENYLHPAKRFFQYWNKIKKNLKY